MSKTKSQRPLFLAMSLVALLGAGVAYQQLRNDENQAKIKSDQTKPPLKPQASPLAASKPLSRGYPRSHEASATQDIPPGAIGNERILRFKDDASYQAFLNKAKQQGLTILGHSDILKAIRIRTSDLDHLGDIEGAESGYNYVVNIPPPPSASAQPGASGFGANALAWLGVSADNSSWGQGVTVAVLDSGVNQHIALQGNVTHIELSALAEGSSQLGHGTAVASIISGDHPLTPGVAPASDILSIRISDESGTSNSFTLAEGIIQAVDGGASVINISMGSYGDSSMVADAVQYAQDHGAVIVASAGNEGLDTLAFPAAYPGVIAVGAVEQGGAHLDFSNSHDQLNITAPGYEVNAAWGTEQLTRFSGTSASAPFISGAIAATLSENPEMSAQDAANLVTQLSNDAGYPGPDAQYGEGTLDLGRVMNHDTPGIYDAAISSQLLIPANSPANLPEIWVTIQNRGTETLINSPVSITTSSGTKNLNISSLPPGDIQTFKIPVLIPYDGASTSVSSSVGTQEADSNPANNSQSASFSLE
ncbi:S8 family serine peptidase [Verrucomicrobiaceae bacterium N1E253]|uniref:S8 family serine peptidase n=1 Tax=Oceaniferula marina TaxID=2748318 RepID=A0A851GHJ9_9BACT|nr:S8 family serine peptidase [Oceaniferula marina]NWK57003.1 S8 family serine peptidase [Oceaniferula marina]